MKSLLKYLKPYIKESILGPLFKLIEASFELLIPLVVASIVSKGIGMGDKAHILKMGGVMIGLGFVGLLCAVTAQYFAAKAATGFASSLREEIFKNIQNRTYNQLETYGTGSLITRITSDVNQLQTGVNLVLRLFLRSPFIVFGAVIMAFVVDVKGAIIFVICVPILFIIVFFVLIKSIPLYKRVQIALDKVTIKTRENLLGVRVLRAFNSQKEETEDFNEDIAKYKSVQLIAGRVGALMNPATFLVVNVATLCVLYVGAKEVNLGIIEQGALIALINYMSQILVELIKLANLIITVTKSLACADRISEMLKEETKEVQEDIQIEKVESVEFKQVGFTYPQAGKESLNNISFKAKKGDIVGIIGGTGSGKTTLINVLCGFYAPTEGEVLVNNINLQKTINESAENISENDSIRSVQIIMNKLTGIVLQTAVLFSGTIEENLKWGKKDATEDEMINALKRAAAYDFVMEKEGNLKAAVQEGGKNFSGGQRQRLSIARAFVKEPEILILDDSTSALDYVTEKKVRTGIREIARDSICFIVSQRSASIMDADLILVLEDGELAGIGKHEELIENCEVYKEICKSQLMEDNKKEETK